MDMRGVSQTPDGRYYVRFRKGRDKKEPLRTKRYFGRGQSALNAARRYLDSLPDRRSEEWKRETKQDEEKDLVIAQQQVKIKELRDKVHFLAMSKEKYVRDSLVCSMILNGCSCIAKEVATPSGMIDILTDKHIIEVKHDKNWKSGVGQLISYGQSYPDRIPVLYLFSRGDKASGNTIDIPMVIEVVKVVESIGGFVAVDSPEVYQRLVVRKIRAYFSCFFDAEANIDGVLRREKKKLYKIKRLSRMTPSLLQATVEACNPL